MDYRTGFAVCVLLLAVWVFSCPGLIAADDFMVLRNNDVHVQSIQLDRPSESVSQIQFRGNWRPFGRDDAIKVIGATYGRHCGAPYGNATSHLASACDGQSSCDYVIDQRALGDSTPGCAKDYLAEWQCGRNPQRYSQSVLPEAGLGTKILLKCPAR